MSCSGWLLAQLVCDIAECLICVCSDLLNGRQADNDDQREHHGVLYRGRAIFRNEESLHLLGETLHSFLQILGGHSAMIVLGCGQKTNLTRYVLAFCWHLGRENTSERTLPLPRFPDLVSSRYRK